MSSNPEAPPLCAICHKPVEWEDAKTNSRGEPVHEECYISRVIEDETPSPE